MFAPFKPPAYTQTPNELIDDWLPHLSHVELKVLMVIIRKTFGWHKIRDRISLSQLEKMTGSKRSNITSATKNLEKKGLIKKYKIGNPGEEESHYELVIKEDSNNCYQSHQGTGGGPARGPTKETYQKKKKEKEIYKEKDSPSAQTSQSFFIFEKIKMKQQAYDDLVSEFGKEVVDTKIQAMHEYSETKARKFREYTDHAKTLRNWIKKDIGKNGSYSKKDVMELLSKLKEKNIDKFRRGEIEILKESLAFKNGSFYLELPFGDAAFKTKLIAQLLKMGIDTKWMK